MVLEQKCVENCDFKSILNKTCIIIYLEKESENESNDKILQNLEKSLINGDFNITNIENGNNQIVEVKNMVITLTTAKDQKDEKKI